MDLTVRMDTLLSFGAADTGGAGTEGSAEFDVLVQTYRPRVFRFLLASVRDRESAENLTQDCFLRAYRARDQFRGDSSRTTWLMQIAINLVRKHESNSRLRFWRRALRPGLSAADLRDCLPDRQVSPEAAVLAKEQVNAIWTVVTQLSERQRTVFLLRFVEEMDLLEIAGATGMKEGTVKTHLFRALQSVRAKLEVTK
jgi:RNA polymerase sigma-70 factor (ECF subfamily)